MSQARAVETAGIPDVGDNSWAPLLALWVSRVYLEVERIKSRSERASEVEEHLVVGVRRKDPRLRRACTG